MCARTELVSSSKRKFCGIGWPLKNSWTYRTAADPCVFFIQRTQYLRRVLGAWRLTCLLLFFWNRVSLVIPPCQKSRYATYFDVAVLRCLLQPHWSEEGTQWSLMYYLQRLRHMLQEKPEKPPEPEVTPLPRLRSSSMVAAAPSLVNTHKTQVSGCVDMKPVWCSGKWWADGLWEAQLWYWLNCPEVRHVYWFRRTGEWWGVWRWNLIQSLSWWLLKAWKLVCDN